MTFVDTSAIYAILDRDDSNHPAAKDRWVRLIDAETVLVTSNYVLVESCALAQNRLGLGAVRAIHEDIIPVMNVCWMDANLHALAMAATIAAGRRKLSLVDCSSFAMMRQRGIRNAFAFDKHFVEEGFRCH